MAKSAPKTNALGMNLSPNSFKASVDKITPTTPDIPPVIMEQVEVKKPEIKGASFTLDVEDVRVFREIAKRYGMTASKLMNLVIKEFNKQNIE